MTSLTDQRRTVPLDEAAQLLGMTVEALEVAAGQGDVAVVLTPEGQREMPGGHLDELRDAMNRYSLTLDEVTAARRLAAAALDVDTLLPPLTSADKSGHRPAELRALVYHRLVAKRLDENLCASALAKLDQWVTLERIHPKWERQWREALALPLTALAALIGADSEQARGLHQTSPFAGVLNEQERRRLLEGVEAVLARL